MMISELQISCLRNIRNLRLPLHPHLNILCGKNGSGKTTFLESLYLLSSGHSFRTREISSLLTHGCDALTVFAKTSDEQRISIQKSLRIPTVARLNGESCSSSSELAAFLPSQVFYQDMFQFIDAGPVVRRAVLDWGLFHVEPGYLTLWKDYRRVLKQRNSLLKQGAAAHLLTPWNNQMTELAQSLHSMRERYVAGLCDEFNRIILILSDLDCRLHYFKGWDRKDEGRSLADLLHSSYERDRLRQYTHYGPHQADLVIVGGHYKVKQYLSRGQQKMVLFALRFAQAALLNKTCLYLIDDMASELDSDHIARLMTYIAAMKGQFFITARPDDDLFAAMEPCDHKKIVLESGTV